MFIFFNFFDWVWDCRQIMRKIEKNKDLYFLNCFNWVWDCRQIIKNKLIKFKKIKASISIVFIFFDWVWDCRQIIKKTKKSKK